ncbi:zinc finger-containing ubiquitin peptidase 1-like isoform X2 [Asterias amurensis]
MSLQLFNCEICGQEAMTEPDLRTHLRLEHEENEGSCPLCDLRHLTLEELHLHVNTAHSLVLSPHQVDKQKKKKADSKDASCSSNENKETIDLVEEFVSVEGSCKTSPIETNERTIHYVSSNRVKQPRSCACHFENGTKLEPDVNGENNFDEHEKELPLCNMEKYSCLRFPSGSSDNNAAKSMSLPIVKDSSSVHVRKRTRSTAQWSSASSASNSVTNIDLFEEHSNRSKSTSSPFKKFLRMFSPNKSKQGKKKSDDDDVEEVQIVSCRSGSDGIWNEDQDDSVMSEPECPFCQISGLDLEAMEQHVEVEHSDAFINSSKTATMNGGHWNTSSTPDKSHPKPTLLSLSKHAHNLHSAVTCPICGLGSYDPDFLAVHINTEHPTPSTSEQTTSIPQNNSNEQHLSDEAGPSRGVETCPICGISASDVTSLNDHVDGHFESPESFTADRQLARQLDEQERQLQERRERDTFKQLQAQYGMSESGSYKQQSEQELEKAVVRGQITVADYNQRMTSVGRSLAEGVDDGKSRTPGLIQKMTTFYTEQTLPGLSYVRLCNQADHFSSTYGDKGWGCGYRNLQILLSSLAHIAEYQRVVFNGQNAIPSIHKLQQLIQAAWTKGFDPQGREQLGGQLVNSRKWIGATEIVAMLSSLHAKCQLIDFHTPSGAGSTHPVLFEWVRDYFGRTETGTSLRLRLLGNNSLKASSIQTCKPPLYLQHQGHSRTIIGCEVHKDNSIRLLLFDPSYKVNDMRGLGMDKLDGYAMRPIRKSLVQMKAKQYQIVSVDRLMTTQQEYEESKILRSQRKP